MKFSFGRPFSAIRRSPGRGFGRPRGVDDVQDLRPKCVGHRGRVLPSLRQPLVGEGETFARRKLLQKLQRLGGAHRVVEAGPQDVARSQEKGELEGTGWNAIG